MTDDTHSSFVDLLCRAFWMMVGPLVLVVLAITIIRTGNGWLTGGDFAYLSVLAGVLLARWLEFRGGQALTAEGKPATGAHLRHYLLGASAIGLAVWVASNLLGNYVLAS